MSDHEHDQTYHQQMKHLHAELEKGIPSGKANYRKSLLCVGADLADLCVGESSAPTHAL